jgi:CheY-like chemotaxis protein
LHFNVKDKQDASSAIDPSINNAKLTPIDILTIDKNSRLTLTKKVKKIISLNPEDKIMVYQDTYNKNILLKVQHDEVTVDNWVLTKSKDNSNNNINIHFKNNGYNKNNGIVNNSNYDKFNIKEIDPKIKNHLETERYQYRYDSGGYIQSSLYNTPILLVDDEQDLLMTFELFLKSEGYKNVKTFSDSKYVIKHLLDLKDSSNYKLVIMDIRMPDINGIQLYQILKILNPAIKIIFLTALDAVNELTSLYSEVKPIDILRKPIEQNQFIKTVNVKVSSILE